MYNGFRCPYANANYVNVHFYYANKYIGFHPHTEWIFSLFSLCFGNIS